jgi:pyruvate dehydrogenase E1 component alpha subunit
MAAGTESESPSLALDREEVLDLYRKMAEIRSFEDRVISLFTRNLVRGSTHLCQGQEAVTVGVAAALVPGDTMTCTYRGHGAVLALGAPLDRAMAEILGKARGLCAGKGGSMHLADASVGALGSFAVIGANLPVTVGAALSAKYRGTKAVNVAFFGDGATNIGAFHEALNLAAIWRLPAIFVCENNLYGEYSPIAATTPIDRLADRADAYGMPGDQVDGNDVAAVRASAAGAVERARGGGGPTLIEALTYRHLGHSRSDPATYRPAEELDAWLKRDPLTVCRRFAVERGLASEEELDEVRKAAQEAVEEATERALTWDAPALSSRLTDVYA